MGGTQQKRINPFLFPFLRYSSKHMPKLINPIRNQKIHGRRKTAEDQLQVLPYATFLTEGDF